MANKFLKAIKFPDLPDTYVIPKIDNTLTKTGEAADAAAVGSKISGLKEDLNSLGLSVIDGILNVTYGEIAVEG